MSSVNMGTLCMPRVGAVKTGTYLIRKIHLHFSLSVMAPPISGPATSDTASTLVTRLVFAAQRSGGKSSQKTRVPSE